MTQAQSLIYLFHKQSLEGKTAHVIIHNQQINTTTVSKSEVLLVFLFACFLGQLSGYWSHHVPLDFLSSHSMSMPSFS